MVGEHNRSDSCRPRRISRRDFIKLAAVSLLAGCSPTQKLDITSASVPTSTTKLAATPTSLPTSIPTATTKLATTPTSVPTDTPMPVTTPTGVSTATPMPTNTSTPQLNVLGKVVRARHAGVWDGDTLAPGALRQMLDTSITKLTGHSDASEAWAALFDPGERIAIKVNAISTGSTHVPLVIAVSERLQTVGVPAEQIVIFDRVTPELERAGYPVNQDKPGVRCYGTDYEYIADWTLIDTDIGLSNILLGCDALINMPILKAAGGPGISFAMKNHYGTFDKPSRFHGARFERGISELNALPPIKDRTRLIIGDVLTVNTHSDGYGYRVIGAGNTLLMSFDPVAHDTIGLQMTSEKLTADGLNSTATKAQAFPWLAYSAELGLGTNDLDSIELVDINLG